MKYNSQIIILYISLMILVMSCDRCKNKSCEDSYAPISAEFKSYCVFPVGSYWIYENAVTGYRDTIMVLSFESEISKSSKNNKECAESGIMRLSSTAQGEAVFSVNTDKRSNTTWGNSLLLRLSNSSFERFILPDNGLMIHYDTITLNSNLYHDVYVFESLSPESGDPVANEAFAKNIGVIYREYSNGDDYNLVEYHLN